MPRKKKPAIDYGERRQELIELLDSIAKDENTPSRYRVEAIKQMNELLSQAEQIKQAKIREAERAKSQSQSASDRRHEEFQARFDYHRRMNNLRWELTERADISALLKKKGFTKSLDGLSKEQKEAKRRNLWGLVYPGQPFPDNDSELAAWYDNFLYE